MARAKLIRPKKPRSRLAAVHASSAPPDRLNRATWFARCGARVLKLVRSDPRDRNSYQYLVTIAPNAVLDRAVTCKKCRAWLDMSTEDRAAHDAREAAKRGEVFTKLKAKGDADRAARLAEQAATVDAHRDDAAVMLDCVVADPPLDYERSGEVLSAALLAHRLANPTTRGERLWIFKEDGATSARRVGDQPTTGRILCRFCRGWLGNGVLRRDYSRSYFAADQMECAWNHEGAMSVARHTTICALVYLGDLRHPDGARCAGLDVRVAGLSTRECCRSLGHPGDHEYAEREYIGDFEMIAGPP